MNMAAGAIAPPVWVYVGASVLLLTVEDGTGGVQAVRNAEVVSIAPKSCVVRYKNRGTECTERIPLGTLRTASRGEVHSYRYELVDIASERGIMAIRLRELWRARNDAVRAAKRVAEYANDRDAVEAAVRALGTWQMLLESGDLETLTERVAGSRRLA